jgi:hypothetical protein
MSKVLLQGEIVSYLKIGTKDVKKPTLAMMIEDQDVY